MKLRAGQWQFHLPATRNGFLDETLFRNPPDIDDEAFEEWEDLLQEYALTARGNMEESLLYAIGLRVLNGNKPLVMAMLGDPRDMAEHFPASQPLRLEWLPYLEFTTDDEWCRDLGCLRPAEFLRLVDYSNQSLENRYSYAIPILAKDIPRYIYLYGSDVTSWVFLIGDQFQDALDLLRNEGERPSMDELLQTLDWVVQLQVGEDEGYLDYMKLSTAKSPFNGQEPGPGDMELQMNKFGTEYEDLLMELLPMDEPWKLDHLRAFMARWFG